MVVKDLAQNLYSTNPNYILPEAEFWLVLSHEKTISVRAQYTMFDFVSDLGGFWGAIILIPSQLMTYYNSKMLMKTLTDETGFAHQQRHSRKRKIQG